MKRLNPRPIDLLRTRAARQWCGGSRVLFFGVVACAGCSALQPSADDFPSSALTVSSPGEPGAELLASNEGDRYEAVGTNPFVMAAHDPRSTFAADVDTASYDLFVRDVTLGALPSPASVRLEEYVNYFSYGYPAPPADAEQPFSIHLAAAPGLLGTGTTLLRVGITGKVAPPEQTKPANLVFLVDVSGSMQGADRLPLVQQLLRQTLDLLSPSDTVSIVSYAGETRVRLAPTPVSDRARIVHEIEQLTAGGSTAGASGIELAYAQASDGFIEGALNHVILCTDGDFNVGPSSDRELVELIVQKRRTGITLTALGFGTGNLNDSMLEAVSNAGNGFYGVISSEAQAAEYVQERMLSTLSMIAKDVKIQVVLNPEHIQAYRLLGYENRAIADDDFDNDIVDAGEIGAGHQVTALYELVPVGSSLPDPSGAPPAVDGQAYAGERETLATELVSVQVRYKQVDATEADPALEVSASLSPNEVAADIAGADADLSWAAAVAAFSEVLKQSPYAAPERLGALDAVFSAQAGRDDERQEFYQLFQRARGRL